MNLLINGKNIKFTTLTISESIGEVSELKANIYLTDDERSSLNLNQPVIYGDFTGIITGINETLEDKIEVIASSEEFKLKGYPAIMNEYIDWKLEDIFKGKRDTTIAKQPADNSKYIFVRGNSLDLEKNVIINGKVGEGHYIEKIKITTTSTSGYKYDVKSEWNTDTLNNDDIRDYSWTEIWSVHVEDDNGKIIYPSGTIYLKDSDNNVLATLDTTHRIAALQDSNGNYGNGLFFRTPFTLTLDLDQDIIDYGTTTVQGDNILDILKELSLSGISYFNNTSYIQFLFKLESNNLTISQVSKSESLHLRQNIEIKSVSRNRNMKNIANNIDLIAPKNVFNKVNDVSITNYGEYHKTISGTLDTYLGRHYLERQLELYSNPDDILSIEVNDKIIHAGDLIKVTIDKFGIDDSYIVQNVISEHGSEGSINSSIDVSKNTIVNPVLKMISDSDKLTQLIHTFYKKMYNMSQNYYLKQYIRKVKGATTICTPNKPWNEVAETSSADTSHSHTISGDISSGGGHNHSFSGSNSGTTGSSGGHYHSFSGSDTGTTGSDGGHYHSFSGDYSGNTGSSSSSHTHAVDVYGETESGGDDNHTHNIHFTVTSDSGGSSHSHSFSVSISGTTDTEPDHTHTIDVSVSGNTDTEPDHTHSIDVSISGTTDAEPDHDHTIDATASTQIASHTHTVTLPSCDTEITL